MDNNNNESNGQQPQAQRPRFSFSLPNLQMRSGSYLMLLAFFFFLMSNSGPDPRAESNLKQLITRRTAEHDRFRDWVYNNATEWSPPPNEDGSNVTLPSWNRTFELQDWHSDAVAQQLEPIKLEQPDQPHWQNLTGFLKGEWQWLDVSLSTDLNQSTIDHRRGDFGWTKGGKFEWNAKEVLRRPENGRKSKKTTAEDDKNKPTFLTGSVDLQQSSSSVSLDIDALHFAKAGSLYVSSALHTLPQLRGTLTRNLTQSFAAPSSEPLDIRQLPALITQDHRNATNQAILDELTHRIKRMSEILDSHSAQSPESGDTPATTCSFALWAQMAPLPEGTTQEQVDEVERELAHPDGRDVAHLPQPSLDAIAWSKNCNMVLRLNKSELLPMDAFWRKAVTYGAFVAVVGLIQTLLTVRQMISTSTPSSIARISYWTISLQGGMDSYSFVTHLTLGAVVDVRASYALLLPAFFAALSGLLFGLRYAASIRVATGPSNSPPPPPPPPQPTPAQQAAQAAVNRQSTNHTEEDDSSNEPTSSYTPTRETGWQYFWREDSPAWLFLFVGSVCMLLWLLIIIGVVPCAVIAMYSYWIPQIYTNAYRGSARRSLKHEYVIGTTFCRLALPLYLWACPANILLTHKNNWVWALCAYSLLQMSVLELQHWLGARFFVPDSWNVLPEIEQWDYHPAAPPTDLETADGSVDCVICLERIELGHAHPASQEGERERDPLLDKTRESLDAGMLFGRYSYMVPPCHHIAHTKCLEQWLAMKSECPVCRRRLPAP